MKKSAAHVWLSRENAARAEPTETRGESVDVSDCDFFPPPTSLVLRAMLPRRCRPILFRQIAETCDDQASGDPRWINHFPCFAEMFSKESKHIQKFIRVENGSAKNR